MFTNSRKCTNSKIRLISKLLPKPLSKARKENSPLGNALIKPWLTVQQWRPLLLIQDTREEMGTLLSKLLYVYLSQTFSRVNQGDMVQQWGYKKVWAQWTKWNLLTLKYHHQVGTGTACQIHIFFAINLLGFKSYK